MSDDEQNKLYNKIDSPWSNYANKSNDNTLKFLHKAYINDWYSSDNTRKNSAKYKGLDMDAAIKDIYSNMNDYDTRVLNSVSRYIENSNKVSATSKSYGEEIDADVAANVYR